MSPIPRVQSSPNGVKETLPCAFSQPMIFPTKIALLHQAVIKKKTFEKNILVGYALKTKVGIVSYSLERKYPT